MYMNPEFPLSAKLSVMSRDDVNQPIYPMLLSSVDTECRLSGLLAGEKIPIAII